MASSVIWKGTLSYLPSLSYECFDILPQLPRHFQRCKVSPMLMLSVEHQIAMLFQNMFDARQELIGIKGKAGWLPQELKF